MRNAPLDAADDARSPLTADQAHAMIADGGSVHVFMNPVAGMVIGADWDRADVEALIREGASELAGASSAAAGHGLATLAQGRWHFIATRAAK